MTTFLRRGRTAAQLKALALGTMFIDHAGAVFFEHGLLPLGRILQSPVSDLAPFKREVHRPRRVG